MTEGAILPLHFDSTMRSAFVSCPQKFYREFILGWRPQGLSIDLHAGACFASALEDVYRGIHLHKWDLDRSLLVAHAGFLQRWGDFEIPEWKQTAKTLDRMWEAVEEYFKQYSPLTDHVQPYMAADGNPTFEYTFAIPLEPCITFDPYRSNMEQRDELMRTHFPTHPSGSPFLYTGRFDMLGAMSGRPVVRDEKTTGSIGDAWAQQWDLRGQFLGYIWACQACGLNVEEVVVRGVGILKTKITLVEAIKQYSSFLVERWHEQLRRDLWRLRRCWDEGYWDYNFGETCNSYGGCIFRNACSSINPDQWAADFKISRWNPLLKNPVTEQKP